eukprot:TRINITY_DN13788_c0_g1_i1.p1 TRINITY_DN13788_c0_g1~~TRINITY_DN13788_c0_g1_i1.p1  ORF type:complete len:553 (-),score=163.38 TRINITY_DN13788_c0_g1_i1:74-1732(-)
MLYLEEKRKVFTLEIEGQLLPFVAKPRKYNPARDLVQYMAKLNCVLRSSQKFQSLGNSIKRKFKKLEEASKRKKRINVPKTRKVEEPNIFEITQAVEEVQAVKNEIPETVQPKEPDATEIEEPNEETELSPKKEEVHNKEQDEEILQKHQEVFTDGQEYQHEVNPSEQQEQHGERQEEEPKDESYVEVPEEEIHIEERKEEIIIREPKEESDIEERNDEVSKEEPREDSQIEEPKEELQIQETKEGEQIEEPKEETRIEEQVKETQIEAVQEKGPDTVQEAREIPAEEERKSNESPEIEDNEQLSEIPNEGTVSLPVEQKKEEKKEDEYSRAIVLQLISDGNNVKKGWLNVGFYLGVYGLNGGSEKVDLVLNHWKGDYRKLEDRHDYVQWLFPNFFRSQFNRNAVALTSEEAAIFRNNKEIIGNLVKAYHLFYDFLGIVITDEQRGTIEGAPNVKDRLKKTLIERTHNQLRIYRLLTHFHNVGFKRYAENLVDFLVSQMQSGLVLHRLENTDFHFNIICYGRDASRQDLDDKFCLDEQKEVPASLFFTEQRE